MTTLKTIQAAPEAKSIGLKSTIQFNKNKKNTHFNRYLLPFYKVINV